MYELVFWGQRKICRLQPGRTLDIKKVIKILLSIAYFSNKLIMNQKNYHFIAFSELYFQNSF